MLPLNSGSLSHVFSTSSPCGSVVLSSAVAADTVALDANNEVNANEA